MTEVRLDHVRGRAAGRCNHVVVVLCLPPPASDSGTRVVCPRQELLVGLVFLKKEFRQRRFVVATSCLEIIQKGHSHSS